MNSTTRDVVLITEAADRIALAANTARPVVPIRGLRGPTAISPGPIAGTEGMARLVPDETSHEACRNFIGRGLV
jgi:hypothetical protein